VRDRKEQQERADICGTGNCHNHEKKKDAQRKRLNESMRWKSTQEE